MFQNLTDFSYKRDGRGAIGFYLAYFCLGMLLALVAGGIAGVSAGGPLDKAVAQGIKVGAVVSIIFCLILSIWLMTEKKLFKSFSYILLALLSGLLAIFGGALLGLIIPAFLTTRKIQ